MRLVAVEFMTLDGVIQAPGHATEDADGFALAGGRSRTSVTTGATSPTRTGLRTDSCSGEPRSRSSPGIAHALNTRPKYVVSSTLTSPTWQPTTILEGDITEQVTELKRRPGRDLLVVGSSQLAQRLITDGLIDEYQLWFHPVAVGAGKRLFPTTATPIVLNLVNVTVTPTGLLIATYQPKRTTTETRAA